MLFSLLDLPCGVVPITQVEKGDVLSEETISQFGWIRRGVSFLFFYLYKIYF